jgi:hypothetical protein
MMCSIQKLASVVQESTLLSIFAVFDIKDLANAPKQLSSAGEVKTRIVIDAETEIFEARAIGFCCSVLIFITESDSTLWDFF